MQINNLKLNTSRKKRKTVGRGGKKGTYSGRGVKGQKSRSGAKINPLFEGGRSTLIDRMKKKRGFKSSKISKAEVKFSEISQKFENGAKITLKDLIEKGLVDRREISSGVKVLGPKTGKKEFVFGKKVAVSKTKKD